MPQPSVPSRKPVQTFPSPEILDELFWEKVDLHGNTSERLTPGTPHPDRSKFPGVVHVADKPVQGSDNLVIRYWSSQYVLQDAYNYSLGYISESATHPTWARRYLVRRDQYAVAAYRSAFTGVFLIRVDNGGSDYTEPPVVNISGGGGSGATAVAQVSGGAVAWIRVTANGTGYTSDPTIAIAGGGGSGASATALMQGDSKLVHQEVQQLPQEDPRYSEFVTVLRVWETIPGPELVGKVLNTDTGVFDSVYRQVDEYGTTPLSTAGVMESSAIPIDANKTEKKWRVAGEGPELVLANLNNVIGWKTRQDRETLADFYLITAQAEKGVALPEIAVGGLSTTFDFQGETLYLVERSKKPLNDDEDEWTLVGVTFPEPYKEYIRSAVRFPGIFVFLEQFSVPFTFPYRPPFPGVHYNYLRPRTNSIPARATYYFTDGIPASIPQKFTVITPGTESKNVPMQEDTVHSAFQWFITQTGDDNSTTVTLVENIPASSPETYDPQDIYVFEVEVTRWHGNIFKVTVVEASEGKAITYFPPVDRGTGVTIGEFGGGLPVADYIQSSFYAVNTEAGPFGVQLFGYKGPTWTRVQGETSTDAGLVNLGSAVLNTVAFITGDGTSHSEGVEVYVGGNPGSATIIFGSNPANNDQIKLGFLNGDDTYNTTWTFKATLSENTLATGTLTISGVLLDFNTVTIGSRVYEFDSHEEESVTSGNVRVDISPSSGYTVAAYATIIVSAAVGVGQTLEVDGKVYTFVTNGTQSADGDIPSFSTYATQATAIYNAINGLDGINVANIQVECTAFVDGGTESGALLRAKRGGAAGNSIVLESSTTAVTVGGASAGVPTTLANGSDCSAADGVTALVAAINGDSQRVVTAVDGTGNTMDVSSLVGGTASNYAVGDTINGSWGAATLTGGIASAAYEVVRGTTAAETASNFQKAMNASGTNGFEYSTGTLEDPRLYVPSEVESATFVVSTRIGADWTSFGSWQTGGNFEWIQDANGAFPVNDFGTVGNLTGATNGTLLGTLEEAEHSLVCNFQDFDDSRLKERNFPPTPDDLTTSVVQVGNRTAQIWWGHFGGMPLKYQKSVDGVTNWIDGDRDLNSAVNYPPRGTIRKLIITDFAGNEPYRYIRFIISPATETDETREYGPGKVSRLFLQVVWALTS